MPKAKYQNDGTYYYTYINTGEYLPNGKPKYKKIRGKTISKVDEKVKAYHSDSALNIEPSKITVDEWYKQWFKSYKSGCAIKTQKYYEYLYQQHIFPVLASYRIAFVKEAHCSQILENMANKYSLETVKSVRGVLYSLFETAKRNKLISVNPAEKLNARGKPAKHRRALTASERENFLKVCKEQNYLFGFFLYFFGLRRGEALALTGEDIKDGFLTVNKQHIFPDNKLPLFSNIPKTDSGNRKIPIPNKAWQYIDFDNLPKGLIFTNDKHEAWSYANNTTAWNRCAKKAFGKNSEITEHYLRHNYCCMLFENNVDLLTVKEIAGHKDVETTLKIYTHYTEKMKDKGISKALEIG